MLDSPPTCHNHIWLKGYEHACNTGGPEFDYHTEVHFSDSNVGNFFNSEK